MNQSSLNLQPPNDLHWTSQDNWEQNQQQQHQHQNQYYAQNHQQGHRTTSSDWDWENPVILNGTATTTTTTNHGGHLVVPDGKMATTTTMPGFLKAQQQQQHSGFSPNSFSQPQGALPIQSSTGLFHGYHGTVQHQQQQMLEPGSNQDIQHTSALRSLPFASLGAILPTGIVPGTSSFGDLRSYDTHHHRRRLFGLLEMDPRSLCEAVKQEDQLYAEAQARIGLNLGVRTYFSTEDTIARLGKRPRGNSPGAQAPLCQAEGCKADLSAAKHYHRRHKVCELHSKAATVTANGQTQRFCQQCSRFHPLAEFDEGKRSCRKRLADHNRRRRKPQPITSIAESSAPKEDEEEGKTSTPTTTTTTTTTTNTTADNNKATSPSTSLDNSDNSKSSGDDTLHLRTSRSSSSKADDNSGAHSTLLDDGPPETQVLLSSLSPKTGSLVIKHHHHQQQQQQGHCSNEIDPSKQQQIIPSGANLSLSSSKTGGMENGPVAWLKVSEGTRPPVQDLLSSRDLTRSDYHHHHPCLESNFHSQEQQVFGLLESDRHNAAQHEQQQQQQQQLLHCRPPMEFLAGSDNKKSSSKFPDVVQTFKSFGTSMFQSM